METNSAIFAALGDATRIQILSSLSASRHLRAKDVLGHVSITQPTLSHHMNMLVKLNIVNVDKIGRECFYSINNDSVKKVISDLEVLIDDHPKDKATQEVSVISSDDVKKKKNKSKTEKTGKDKKQKKKKKDKK